MRMKEMRHVYGGNGCVYDRRMLSHQVLRSNIHFSHGSRNYLFYRVSPTVLDRGIPTLPAPRSMPPYPHRLILSPTPHLSPIGAPINRIHFILVPRQILLQLPCRHIPNFQCRIFTPANQESAVRAETAHVDGADVAAQGGDEGARGAGPELDVVVEAAAGEEEA